MTDEDIKIIFEKLPDDFWDFIDADTQQYTHGLHTYPATMICPISRNILQLMKKVMPINVALDPFSGSGTVLVESMLAGVETIHGNDINPLALFMSEVKTTPIECNKLKEIIKSFKKRLNNEFNSKLKYVQEIEDKIAAEVDLSEMHGWGDSANDYLDRYVPEDWGLERISFKNMGYWIKPKVLIELLIIKKEINKIEDNNVRRFALLAFSEIIRLVSNRRNGEFKMYRMEADKVRKFNPSTKDEFYKILDRNITKMGEFTNALGSNKSEVFVHSDNAMELKSIEDNSVDIVITSPPYGDSRTTVAYGEFSKLSLNVLSNEIKSEIDVNKIDKNLMGGKKYLRGFKYDLSSKILGKSLDVIREVDLERAGDVYSFFKDLDVSIGAIAKKSKKGSYQFWVVGNRTVKKELLRTDEIIAELGQKYGLNHVITLGRKISNKVMPSSNSPSNIAGETVTTMNNEHIVVLKKV